MTVKEIVVKYLKENGYDGLWNPDGECACGIDDLLPENCDGTKSDILNCESGYQTKCDCGDHDWHIVRDKPKPDGLE